MNPPFASLDVETAFDGFDTACRPVLLALRRLIFDIARDDPRVGPIEEALRWGQPAYLTPETRSGTTLRLGRSKSGSPALFVHCQTTLVSDYNAAFPKQQETEGSRAILVPTCADIDAMRHGWLIRQALTYHL